MTARACGSRLSEWRSVDVCVVKALDHILMVNHHIANLILFVITNHLHDPLMVIDHTGCHVFRRS